MLYSDISVSILVNPSLLVSIITMLLFLVRIDFISNRPTALFRVRHRRQDKIQICFCWPICKAPWQSNTIVTCVTTSLIPCLLARAPWTHSRHKLLHLTKNSSNLLAFSTTPQTSKTTDELPATWEGWPMLYVLVFWVHYCSIFGGEIVISWRWQNSLLSRS